MNTVKDIMDFLYLSAVRYPKAIRDDLVQETLYKFLVNRKKFEALDRMEGYLLVTMRNIFRDYYQKGKPMLYVEDLSELSVAKEWQDANRIEPQLELSFVEKCITKLSEIHREPLLLFMQGYNAKDISILLGITKDRVTSRIHYARKHLFEMEGIKEIARRGKANFKSHKKKIFAYDKDSGELIGEYPSNREASRSLGISCGNISSVMSGRKKQTNGMIFSYDKR